MNGKIFLLLIMIVISIMPLSATATTDYDPSPGSSELPSSSFLQNEKRSLAGSTESGLVASSAHLSSRASNRWDNPFFPEEEESEANLVGGSVGDSSIAMALSLLILYLGYRTFRKRFSLKKEK